MLVIDTFVPNFAKDKEFAEIMFNGRHYSIGYIMTMQFSLGISPSLRSNFDYVFLFEDENVSNKKRIYEHYAGMFPDFKSFKRVYDVLTRDGGCMVIMNRGLGLRKGLCDKIAWYKPVSQSQSLTL